MSIRISGISSGLDTDSIVQELVKAESTKKTELEKKQTKLEWTQSAWQTLNAKVYSFFNSTLGNLQYESNYVKKKTTVTDSSIATIVAGDSATNGTQTLAVKQLATSGYLTGAKLSSSASYSSTTTMADLGAVGTGETASINVSVSGKNTAISISSTDTISSVVTKLTNAGVTASFDEINQRFFISAKSSGEDNDFTITGTNDAGTSALASLGLVASSDIDDTTKAYAALEKETTAYTDAYNTMLAQIQQVYIDQNTTYQAQIDSYNSAKTEYLAKNSDESDTSSATNQEIYDSIAGDTLTEKVTNIEAAVEDFNTRYAALDTNAADYETQKAALDAEKEELTQKLEVAYSVKNFDESISSVQSKIDSNKVLLNTDGDGVEDTTLADQAKTQLDAKIASAKYITSLGSGSSAVRIKGQNAVIELNGAEFESSTNNFSVNNLTITAQTVSASSTKYYDADGNEVDKSSSSVASSETTYTPTTINTQDDVDSIYDMIKNFITGYNALVNEFDSLYNADSAKGYEPLSDDEKDAMTDTQIEDWEAKVKAALLRRDSNLSTVTSTFKTAMLQSFTVNGEETSLTDYGIETLSYFLAADNEKGAYHIAGDSSDSSVSSQTDKLKTAIASDPTSVATFFSKLTSNLYTKLNTMMRSSSYRSVYNIYDDKKMQSEYDDYTEEIEDQEERITALEDRYYSQFSAMEVAISKLNSTQSAVSSLFSS